MTRPAERRRLRSSNPAQALRYQLAACREDAGMDALLLADADGLCVLAAGFTDTCEEVAARLPLLGRKAGDFHGVLLGDHGGTEVMVRRFNAGGGELFACAVGGRTEETTAEQLDRSVAGVTRILAAG